MSKRKNTIKKINANESAPIDLKRHDLEGLSRYLNELSLKKLPDNCMQGYLRGKENEIRNEAILLALDWHANTDDRITWDPLKSISCAIRFAKLRKARVLQRLYKTEGKRNKELMYALSNDEHSTPVSSSPNAFAMAYDALSYAVRMRAITHANAYVALMTLRDGMPVSEIAKKLNIHKSAVHQHIARVRKAVPRIIDLIEDPRFKRKDSLNNKSHVQVINIS